MIITPSEDLSPQELARTYLSMAAEHYHHTQEQRRLAQNGRAHFAELAKQHGITNVEIAHAYGISETAVRAMLKRAGEA